MKQSSTLRKKKNRLIYKTCKGWGASQWKSTYLAPSIGQAEFQHHIYTHMQTYSYNYSAYGLYANNEKIFSGNVEIIQCILLLQRTHPIHSPILDSSQPPVIPAQVIQYLWAFMDNAYTCTHLYTDTEIQII